MIVMVRYVSIGAPNLVKLKNVSEVHLSLVGLADSMAAPLEQPEIADVLEAPVEPLEGPAGRREEEEQVDVFYPPRPPGITSPRVTALRQQSETELIRLAKREAAEKGVPHSDIVFVCCVTHR